jgi:hypothetical protein
MTDLDIANLNTIRSNLLAQLAAMGTVPPDGNLDGQSEQWTAQYKTLTDQIETLNRIIAMSQPFAFKSRGRY